MRKHPTWGRVAGVAPILELGEGQTSSTAYTVRRVGGPSSQCGAGEDVGSIWQVTRVTAVLQYCTYREGSPVGFCEVYPAVLDHVWPHAS